MSSITLKISSLLIRTLSKPIANRIKKSAREHERFRRICISFAQSLHRLDMRLRLGLLQDQAAIDKQIAREAAEAQAKRLKSEIPTVKTEAQSKLDEVREKVKGKEIDKDTKTTPVKPKIRPLSEAKAIDSGANFISETFLFSVGLGLIIFESWRSLRRENSRRVDVAERLKELEDSEKAARRALVELEREVLRLRAKESKSALKPSERILPKEVWQLEETEEQEDEGKKKRGFLLWLRNIWPIQKPRLDGEDTTDEVPKPSRAALLPLAQLATGKKSDQS